MGNPLGTDSILKLVLRFSLPAIVSFVVTSLYNLVDQIFIGWGIGEIGMAATNVSFPLTTACVALQLLFGTGGAAVCNLNLGRGDEKTAAKASEASLFMLAVSGIFLGAVTLIFYKPLLYAFGATDAVMGYAVPYTVLIAVGFPFQIFAAGAALLIRADGSPRYAMFSVMAGAVFNLIFDPVFLFVMHMGIVGIALATVLGQILSFGIVLYYLLKKVKSIRLTRSGFFRLDMKIMRRVAAIGAAASLNQVAMMAVQITMNNGVRKYGAMAEFGAELPLAAVGAISKIQVLFLSVILGLAQGCQPIISFNYGAKNFSRVKQAFKITLTAVMCASIFSFLCYQIFPRQIMAIFGSNDPLYLKFAVMYLRIFMFMTFAAGLQPFATNFFTSIGKPKMGTALTLTRQAVLLIPLLIILPRIFGLTGMLYAGPAADFCAAVLAVVLMTAELKQQKILQNTNI